MLRFAAFRFGGSLECSQRPPSFHQGFIKKPSIPGLIPNEPKSQRPILQRNELRGRICWVGIQHFFKELSSVLPIVLHCCGQGSSSVGRRSPPDGFPLADSSGSSRKSGSPFKNWLFGVTKTTTVPLAGAVIATSIPHAAGLPRSSVQVTVAIICPLVT